ncbi:hypothetical protein WA158_005612 [Blastocystis sp. Blastoise]
MESPSPDTHVHKSDLLKRFCAQIDYVHVPPQVNSELKNQIKNVMCAKGFEICDSAISSHSNEQIFALKAKIRVSFWESIYKIHLEIAIGSESYPNVCPGIKVLCPVNYQPNPHCYIIDKNNNVLSPLMAKWDSDHKYTLLQLLQDICYQFECTFPYISKEHVISNYIRDLYMQGNKNENLFSPQTLLQVSIYEREVKRDMYNTRNIYSIRDGIYNGSDVSIYIYKNTSLETKMYIDRAICSYINLRHPHLISTYGKCMYNNIYPCIVLERHNITLYNYIKQLHHPLSASDKKEMMLQIADGLMYIHDHHYIHRNLNPHCIFLCQGMLKIGGYEYIRNTDEMGELSNTGECIYKAPEQVLYQNFSYGRPYYSTDRMFLSSGALNISQDGTIPAIASRSMDPSIQMNNALSSSVFNTNNSTLSMNSNDNLSVDSISSTSSMSSSTKNKHILEYNQSVDIHAFALIIYLIYVGEEPFDGEWNDRIFTAMFKNNVRPQIPNTVPKEVANLISHCWNPLPNKRPNIKAVYNYIYNYKP